MLTEKDFDEIGKRLYDHESDPPENGWKKIYSDLNDKGPDRTGFFKKHWWKGLFIILPVVFYYIYDSNGSTSLQTSGTKDAAISSEPLRNKEENEASKNDIMVAEKSKGTIPPDATNTNDETLHNPELASRDNNNARSATNDTKIQETSITKDPKNGLVNDKAQNKRSVNIEMAENSIKEKSTSNEENQESKPPIGFEEKSKKEIVDEPKPTDLAAVTHLNNEDVVSGRRSNSAEVVNEAKNKNANVILDDMPSDGESRTESGSNAETPQKANMIESAPNEIISKAENEDQLEEATSQQQLNNQKIIIRQMQDQTNRASDEKTVQEENPGPELNTQAVLDSAGEQNIKATHAPALNLSVPTSGESVSKIEPSDSKVDTANWVVPDSILLVNNEKPRSDDGKTATEFHKWRASLSIMPQYLVKQIKPLGNDEILVTEIKKGNFNSQKQIGLAVSVGGGKAITENFFIDAQLSYQRIEQSIAYAYSTGAVDTLVAAKQPDGTVRVMPVYEVTDLESVSKLNYGGLRLGGTYYFWSKYKRRFNFSASAGLLYVLSSDFSEKINGVWATKKMADLEKLNYNVTLGAGYNLAFGEGWEFMISPTITYFLKKGNETQQPFNLNQRSYGINLMLLKYF